MQVLQHALSRYITAYCSLPASGRRSVTFFQLFFYQERMVLFISFRIDFKCLPSLGPSVFPAGVIGRIPVVPRNKSCPYFTFLPFQSLQKDWVLVVCRRNVEAFCKHADCFASVEVRKVEISCLSGTRVMIKQCVRYPFCALCSTKPKQAKKKKITLV